MTVLAELRQVEQDLETVRQTVSVAERLGFGSVATSLSTLATPVRASQSA